MDANPKNTERRGRRLLKGLMTDWVWDARRHPDLPVDRHQRLGLRCKQ